MTKYLLLSDSHQDNQHLSHILNHNQDCDIVLHAGDSCLDFNDPLLTNIYTVKGNHDTSDFPIIKIINNIFLTHGNIYHVYQSLNPIILEAKKHGCTTVVHGHTHVPFHKVIDGIRVINPGSTMFNRGSYGYGTYAIYDDDVASVHFYHHETFECVDDIALPDGLALLEEFRSYNKK